MASWQAEDAKLEAESFNNQLLGTRKTKGSSKKGEEKKKTKSTYTGAGPHLPSESSESEESNSDDYIDVEDDEDSENEGMPTSSGAFIFDLPKPNEKLPEGDSVFEINRAFLKTISDQKGADPNGWQKLFEDFKDCMGRENNAFKAWALCQ